MPKRFFDIFFSVLALIFLSWLIIFAWIIASFDTRSNGFFIQERVGQFGKIFKIYKLKTIRHTENRNISNIGKFFRKSKIDELPQLLNILLGQMSFVGYRPDIVGYYDKLEDENRNILKLKPGLTSLASIKYANEESLLSKQNDPLEYNDKIIFPDKVKMNLEYYHNHSIFVDFKIILKTIFRI